MLQRTASSELIRETCIMCLAVVLEGEALSVAIGVCLLILGLAAFVWGQWAWEKHTKAGRVALFLTSALLLVAGLMFLGIVNYLERTWGI